MQLVTRQVVATAQIGLSLLYTVGYFTVLYDFIHGKVAVPSEWKEVMQTLLSFLTAAELMILQFWFSRSRPQDTNASPTS